MNGGIEHELMKGVRAMQDKDDYRRVLERAKKEIEGRADYWRTLPNSGHVTPEHVVANLEWAAAQLDMSPGRCDALRKQEQANGV